MTLSLTTQCRIYLGALSIPILSQAHPSCLLMGGGSD
jgi:hypothetical protein